MEQKKPTKGILERRIRDAIVFVPKDRDTKSIYFSDKGLRLTHTSEFTIIATGFHRHVYDNVNVSGFSRPALYTSRLIDIAIENDPVVENSKGEKSYSLSRLLEILKEKEDKTEYNIVTYVSWWLEIVFAPLYAIDENAASQFNVYFKYLNHIATQHIFLSEHKDGLTNKQFVKEHDELMDEFLKNIEESPIFEPMSDEQRVKQEMEAMQQQEAEQAMQPEA